MTRGSRGSGQGEGLQKQGKGVGEEGPSQGAGGGRTWV